MHVGNFYRTPCETGTHVLRKRVLFLDLPPAPTPRSSTNCSAATLRRGSTSHSLLMAPAPPHPLLSNQTLRPLCLQFQLVFLPYCPLPLNLSATSCLKPQCKGLALISPSSGPACLCWAAPLNRKDGSHIILSSKPRSAALGI